MAIFLIGPPGAGKSSVGALLAGHLGRAFLDADAVCTPYYAEVGWSVERLRAKADRNGFEAAHRACGVGAWQRSGRPGTATALTGS